MRKLKLQMGDKQMLTKEQMKKITGGGSVCHIYCCTGGPGTCGSGVVISGTCTNNEDCQALGNQGFQCESGEYLAGLCL